MYQGRTKIPSLATLIVLSLDGDGKGGSAEVSIAGSQPLGLELNGGGFDAKGNIRLTGEAGPVKLTLTGMRASGTIPGAVIRGSVRATVSGVTGSIPVVLKATGGGDTPSTVTTAGPLDIDKDGDVDMDDAKAYAANNPLKTAIVGAVTGYGAFRLATAAIKALK